MKDIEFPITKIEDNRLLVQIDLHIYAKESIASACYKYTDRFYIHQTVEKNFVMVFFESKDHTSISEIAVKQFCNELIDQQVRYNTNQQFSHIRDLIVEEAFKPVSV